MIVNSHRFGGGVPAALGHYSFDDGDYLQLGGRTFPIPNTMTIWFKAPGTNLVANFMKALNASTPGSSMYFVYCSTNQVKFGGVDNVGAAITSAVDTSTFNANTWHLATGYTTSTSSRTAIMDAVTGGSAGGSFNISGIDTYRIGNAAGESANGPVKLAHAAFWDKVLSGAEITELLTKIPSSVAAGSLLFYAPLNDGTATDVVSASSLTATATPTANTTDGPALTS